MSLLMAYGLVMGDQVSNQITISIGDHAWSIGTNFIVYLIIAAVVGIVAEAIVGWRLPFGIIGAVVAGVVGIWLTTQLIKIDGVGDWNVYGVPIIRALIGSIVLVGLWHTLTYNTWRGRNRYYRRYDD
ncbi:MAG: GlsB/YeaQ/YmgE family stress response membrane protein [Ktedonobacteraceae bacterium]|nr:GlsB/YeaQ/YmgE family stress response membrane protein [Ktedonobacteraceae bacterium]